MSETTIRQIVLAARPKGPVRPTDFRLEESSIANPGAGEMLLRVQYLSLDPYMRGRMEDRKSYARPAAIGDVMPAESIAVVMQSNLPDYAGGDRRHAGASHCPHLGGHTPPEGELTLS
jgi:NADPH-dependent curcumin reductase CurA